MYILYHLFFLLYYRYISILRRPMLLSEELNWRGYNGYTTFKNIGDLDNNQISFYIGVDPSSDSMTIGNLAAAMMVRMLINHGHSAYLLVGGATGLIGDPDGKSSERQAITYDQVERNKQNIKLQYDRIFKDMPYQIVDNYDWFKDINYLDFLRDVGKHVPLSSMLARDFVKTRLGEGGGGISYAEFSYSLIQGYDFLYLYQNHGVTLQLCGVDQIGNVIAGIDLIRRKENIEAHVLAMPLVVNKTTGVKFGKTESGAVWLDESKTSVFKFYQFWLNDDDDNVIDHLKIYTTLSKENIESIEADLKANPGARSAQKTLAHEVTSLVHGKERTESVERVSGVLFGAESFTALSEQDKLMLSNEIPVSPLGVSLIEALVSSNIAESNGAARRLIQAGAISVNGEKKTEDFTLSQSCLVKKGKNSFVLIK